jgi:hypothetical protein
VLAEVDAFMADFDRRQRLVRWPSSHMTHMTHPRSPTQPTQPTLQAEKEEEAALGKPDADGFVTVRRKGRKKVADGGIPIASAKAAPALAAKAQRQESDKVLLDFYRFQRRENRRKRTTCPTSAPKHNPVSARLCSPAPPQHAQQRQHHRHRQRQQSWRTFDCASRRTRRRSQSCAHSASSSPSSHKKALWMAFFFGGARFHFGFSFRQS